MRDDGFTQEISDTVIERLMEGRSLLSICRDKDVPSHATILRWRKKYKEFDEAIPRARAEGSHVLADQCLEIADDESKDVPHRRLQIDTRLRLIGKWNAQAYGDKLALGGADDLPPIQNDVNIKIDNKEVARRIAFVFRRGLEEDKADGGTPGTE